MGINALTDLSGIALGQGQLRPLESVGIDSGAVEGASVRGDWFPGELRIMSQETLLRRWQKLQLLEAHVTKAKGDR